jgi:uncharacterized GH25 family protein
MKRFCAIIGLLLVVPIIQAHEFWLQPGRFQYNVGETASIRFMVGENFVGEPWDLKRHRLIRMDHISHHQTISLLGQVPAENSQVLDVKLTNEGTHVFAMQSNNAFIELQAEEFNAYLKEDGLDEVHAHRQKTNTLNKPAKEFYARCAKVMIQAGDSTDDSHLRKAGLPLEIIPVQNPYAIKQGDEISFQVLYEGKPLPFTLVKVWNRKNNNTILQNIYTQKDGRITTRMGNTGSWMISCVKMIPSKEAGADWQSYWSSLVFGF